MIVRRSNIWLALFLPLVAISLWLRTTSLETMPDIDGDEAFHAVQLTRMLQGRPFEMLTPTGLPLSSFHAIMEFPLLLIFGPSTTILRVPPAFTGILAIVLAYVLGSRVLDRTTGVIASGLIAVLPVTTYISRTAYEVSHAPLYTLLLVYFAFRRNVLGMSLLLMCCYLVHPMTVFVLPVLLAILAARTIEESPAGGLPWRRLAMRLIPPTSIVVAIGLWTMQRPIIHKISTAYETGIRGRHDPREFLTYLGRLFLGLGLGSWPKSDLLIWSVFLVVLVPGMVRLVRRKRWDRVALVAGVVASAAALFLVGGSKIIQPGMSRYGYFLVVPTILGFACLIRELLVTPAGVWSGLARSGQIAVLLAAAGALQMANRLDLLKPYRVVDSFDGRGEESPWTFGTDRQDPRKLAFTHVVDDMARDGTDRAVIFTVEPMSRGYFDLLALSHPGIDVRSYDETAPEPCRAAVLAGAYTINPGLMPNYLERSYLANWSERWEIPGRDGILRTAVSRLAREIPVAGDFDHDGRLDPACFRRSDAHWIASLSGGGTMDVAFGSRDGLELPAPGDYDGDRKLDLAVFRPSTDEWMIKLASGPVLTIKFGEPNGLEVPIPGDYDGDGRTDLGLYVPLSATFVISSSSGRANRVQKIGALEHTEPAVGDYDGDGELDLGVLVSDKSTIVYLPSRGGREVAHQLGPPGRSVPAPGDYDGDGKTDFAVFVPGSSAIAYRPSKGGEDVIRPFGPASESLIAPGDYDGDGKADLSVFIPRYEAFAYRPSKGGSDVVHLWGAGGKAEIAASRPGIRK